MSRKIEVQIVGDASSLQRAFGSASSSANSFGSSLGGKVASGLKTVGKLAGGAALAGIAGFAATVTMGAKSLIEHEKANAQLNAVLKSTKNAANTSTEAISEHAAAIENLSGIDDVAVKKGAAFLLTFKNITNQAGEGNDIFNQTVDIMTDMSVAMGQDMQTSALQLGKALNDPVRGMTALQRVGVTFTESQREAIKAMVESGDVMGAQKIILAELTSEFGGSAAALGDTFAGKVEILKAKFEGLAETVAQHVMPYADRFVTFLGSVLEADSAGEALSRFFGGLKSIGTDIYNAIKDAVSQIDWSGVWSTIKGFVSSLASKLGGLDWSAIGSTVMRVIGSVLGAIPWADAVGKTIEIGGKLLEAVVGAIKAVDWSEVGKTVLGVVGEAISAAFSAGADLGSDIGYDLGYKLGENIAKGLKAVIEFVASAADDVMSVVQKALEAGGKLPDWLGGGQFRDWAAEVAGAREDLKKWVDGLGKASDAASDFSGELNDSNAQMKLAQSFATEAARALAETKGSFSIASRGASELVENVGRLAGLKPPEIKALINDQEFLGKLAEMVAKIKEMPGSKEFRAQALVAEAQRLVEEFTGRVRAIPDKSTTNVSVPGARESKNRADEVHSAVAAIPNHSNTSITTSGVQTALNQIDSVIARLGGIPSSISTTVYTNYVDVHTGNNAGGTPYWRGGPTWVGERGPELITLPRGSAVHSAVESRAMMGATGGQPVRGGDTINIALPNYLGSRQEVERWLIQVLTRYKHRNGVGLASAG